MEFVTHQDFLKAVGKAQDKNYYHVSDRWNYYKAAIDIIRRHGPFEKVLEIGPAWVPVIVNCDILDNTPSRLIPTYQHNVKTIPWPIRDNHYDLVIALQVWEHIYNRQIEAFSELRRVAKAAVMSFPLNWKCRQPLECANCHCGITEQTIRAWIHNIEPSERLMIQDSKGMRHKRLIYYLELA